MDIKDMSVISLYRDTKASLMRSYTDGSAKTLNNVAAIFLIVFVIGGFEFCYDALRNSDTLDPVRTLLSAASLVALLFCTVVLTRRAASKQEATDAAIAEAHSAQERAAHKAAARAVRGTGATKNRKGHRRRRRHH